jgi:hypothetical protein
MGWPKGKLRPPGTVGRKVGSKDKRSEGIEAFARSIVEDPVYQAKLFQRATEGSLPPGMEAMLFHYAYGRPREQQPNDQAFMEDLVAVVLKHASTHEARREIREVLEAHTGGTRLSAVA